MRLIFLTIFSLSCFAANSLLCRAALKTGAIDAASFTFIRLFCGALSLFIFIKIIKKEKLSSTSDIFSVIALLGYAIFFSLSYIKIDAGIGAFLLFGSVQVTMIGWSLLKKMAPSTFEIIGLILALLGLALFTVPGKMRPDIGAAILMIMAGFSWGVYSLRGKTAQYPLMTTAGNFIFSLPIAILFPLFTFKTLHLTTEGILLASISGALTSGLGYTVWYMVLPLLGVTRAAVIQLSVPVIALAVAVPLLGERPSAMSLFAGLMILMGVAISLMARQTIRRS